MQFFCSYFYKSEVSTIFTTKKCFSRVVFFMAALLEMTMKSWSFKKQIKCIYFLKLRIQLVMQLLDHVNKRLHLKYKNAKHDLLTTYLSINYEFYAQFI